MSWSVGRYCRCRDRRHHRISQPPLHHYHGLHELEFTRVNIARMYRTYLDAVSSADIVWRKRSSRFGTSHGTPPPLQNRAGGPDDRLRIVSSGPFVIAAESQFVAGLKAFLALIKGIGLVIRALSGKTAGLLNKEVHP